MIGPSPNSNPSRKSSSFGEYRNRDLREVLISFPPSSVLRRQLEYLVLVDLWC
uniref:Uncharacterized protein n=1 Tax=Arundo donax TaxID=35708 RepID=A0A0A9BSF6_ARUDO